MRTGGGGVGLNISDRAKQTYNQYQLSKMFHCLPSELDKQDVGKMLYFEKMFGFENQEQRNDMNNLNQPANGKRTKTRHHNKREG